MDEILTKLKLQANQGNAFFIETLTVSLTNVDEGGIRKRLNIFP